MSTNESLENFKEIQAAYQMALSMRNWRDGEAANMLAIEKNKENINDFETDSFKLSEAPIDEKQHKFEQQQKGLIENLYKQLHAMAFAPLAVKDKLENWKFIEGFYQIDDLVLKGEVARVVFKKVSEYNLFQLKQNNTLLIKASCLRYMDDVFDWHNKWKEYQLIFPELYFDYVDYSKTKENILQRDLGKTGYVLGRFWAFIVDFFIAVMFVSGIASIKQLSVIYENVFPYTLIMIPLITELVVTKRASIGKLYNGLMAVDEFGNICSKKQVLLRHFFFYLFLVPFYLDSYLLFITLLALHTITIIKYKLLLHDFLSKTRIIKT